MSTLYLNRTSEVVEDGEPARVVCEPKAGVSKGWCARIAADPADPHGMWARDYLRGEPAECGGRPVEIYAGLEAGTYEASSTRSSRRSQSVCFAVTAGGEIEVLGGTGDEDLIIARLNGMNPDELHDARAAAPGGGDLPPLEGSIRQVAWGDQVRAGLIRDAEAAGDLDLAARLRRERDATWFIANRDRPPAELRARLGVPG